MKPPAPTELQIQADFRKRLYYAAPAVRVVAIPNGTHIASMTGRRKAAREGLSAGFPDVQVLAPGGMIAFIEFKRPSGRVSDNQAEWHDRLARLGFNCTVARSADDAVAWLRGLGFPIREAA